MVRPPNIIPGGDDEGRNTPPREGEVLNVTSPWRCSVDIVDLRCIDCIFYLYGRFRSTVYAGALQSLPCLLSSESLFDDPDMVHFRGFRRESFSVRLGAFFWGGI